MGQSDVLAGARTQEALEARELRSYLRTMGDSLRLLVLHLLARRGEMHVTEMVAALHVSQPLLSWHLGVLRRCDLVAVRREGRVVWYSLNRPSLRAYRARLDAWLDGVAESAEGEEDGRCLGT